MAKTYKKACPKTKIAIIRELAYQSDLTQNEVERVLLNLAALAYRGALEIPKGFPIPGIGKLMILKRKARSGWNPRAGKAIEIPAKNSLKFRVSKVAKDAILPKVK